MTVCDHPSADLSRADAVAAHLRLDGLIEAFSEVAGAELAAAPLAVPGVCFRPGCSRDFTPARDWQTYCSAACRQADTEEMRAWGHRMALALLVWRAGKYETRDPAIRARTSAARRWIAQAQSAWAQDRRARVEMARKGVAT